MAACPPPGGGGTPPPTPTYTTTVSGKVITPAKAADSTKGSIITTARVWASTDPAKKVAVGADGSYSLQVAGHSGSFTITAEYTATGNKNYKTGAPRTVTTKGAAIDGQDIPLNYGHTTVVTVQAGLFPSGFGSGGSISNGVTVVITTEDGHEVGRGITSGTAKNAVITVDHPGRMTITASNAGYRNASISPRTTRSAETFSLNLAP